MGNANHARAHADNAQAAPSMIALRASKAISCSITDALPIAHRGTTKMYKLNRVGNAHHHANPVLPMNRAYSAIVDTHTIQ